MQKLETRLLSSLSKLMPGKNPENVIRNGEALKGERFSFQLAFRNLNDRTFMQIKVDSSFGKSLRVRETKRVPVDYTGINFDDDVLDTKPGMYPDLLAELPEDGWITVTPEWNTLWFTVDIPENMKPGVYEITVSPFRKWCIQPDVEYEKEKPVIFKLKVIDAVLPKQTLKFTNWFHCDSLASYYKVPVFSKEHWSIIENFMQSAGSHGINMILTPVFTPPLDTLVGAERPTVQLVDVKKEKGKYSFDFAKLEKWISLAQKCGISYFEIAHLFTQWGARFTPKIMATVNGKEKRIFGWDVSAESKEYEKFLGAFLPKLADFLQKKGLQDKVYFHCSDEPASEHLNTYLHDKRLMTKYLPNFKIMDALSHVEYYKQGLVTIPVPAEAHLEEFLAAGMKERWTYYCCGPVVVYSNRFIHFPSSRNRILGALLYRYRVEGFLHWGFNFYYSGLSRYPIDPYRCSSCAGFYPSGDPFVVYPGRDGKPEDSIRYEVFFEGLQDMRVLELAESLAGREKVEKLLDSLVPNGRLQMTEYPKGEKAVLGLRSKINQLIKRMSAKQGCSKMMD